VQPMNTERIPANSLSLRLSIRYTKYVTWRTDPRAAKMWGLFTFGGGFSCKVLIVRSQWRVEAGGV
jgi:hypothetical protein